MTALNRLFFPYPGDVLPAPRLQPELRAKRDPGLRTAALLLLLALLNAVDLAFTLFAHKIGWLNEMNPVAEVFLSQNLLPSLIAFKLLMVIAGSTMLWRLRHCNWAPAACWILVIAHVSLGVLWYLWAREVSWAYETRLAYGL
jgi:hypothetical protein